MALTTRERRLRIKMRVRKKVYGTADSPRMSVFRSNKEIYVQLINDDDSKVIVSSSSRQKDIASKKGTKSEIAAMVGKDVAEKAIKAGVSTVAFDRNGYLYHGRIKSLADAAREGGLKF
jgi:large subunit ribosomal protein L18